MTMTRRDFLSASAALRRRRPSAPALARAAAARGRHRRDRRRRRRHIARRGASWRRTARLIVVEASGQIGGRCCTDTATFGVPFDRGARWMYNPETNPMIKLARAAGLDVVAAPLGQKIRIGRRNARAGETEEFLAALVRANRAIGEASRARPTSLARPCCRRTLASGRGRWNSCSAPASPART